jgi:hypothetical protein
MATDLLRRNLVSRRSRIGRAVPGCALVGFLGHRFADGKVDAVHDRWSVHRRSYQPWSLDALGAGAHDRGRRIAVIRKQET